MFAKSTQEKPPPMVRDLNGSMGEMPRAKVDVGKFWINLTLLPDRVPRRCKVQCRLR